MRVSSIRSVLFVPTLMAFLASASQGQESTRDDFREYCQVLKGRFTAKITWAMDWEPFAKKGDRTTAYWEARLAEDDHMLIGKCMIGKGSDTAFTFYHPGSKQIETRVGRYRRRGRRKRDLREGRQMGAVLELHETRWWESQDDLHAYDYRQRQHPHVASERRGCKRTFRDNERSGTVRVTSRDRVFYRA